VEAAGVRPAMAELTDLGQHGGLGEVEAGDAGVRHMSARSDAAEGRHRALRHGSRLRPAAARLSAAIATIRAGPRPKDEPVHLRLLDLLRCPTCGAELEVEPLVLEEADGEVLEGVLCCAGRHWFPVAGGIPRMLPDAMALHWPALAQHVGSAPSPTVQELQRDLQQVAADVRYDRRTAENFSLEWEHHELGDNTWGMALDDRVRTYFLDAIRIPTERLDGMTLLDAGCGNGSQSVAYTRYGLDVVAVDLSSGLEHGRQFRHRLDGARPDRVHFVQGDLQAPPFAAARFDIIHSAGVLHHTPDTRTTFDALTPLLRPEGTFYVWLYKYERVVTPLVNGIRAVTTRIPPAHFARLARRVAVAFQLFCRFTDATGIRSYPPVSRREAALALMDIFGAPHAHYHDFAEVEGWYREAGLDAVWPCNETRRGFGACGRRRAS
jgi:2-polyprenyl-3-methyl-5-hydroxy-6-metoxy-1,4-benzoquinol methylase/uncharacterized protein YbaR (Trm112 family)